jgi:phosphoesterase RecJ-like protein
MSVKTEDLESTDAITALLELLRARRTFVITSHQRPDGDAIGSALGLMHLLEAMGKQVTVAFADLIPAPFHCLAGVERIVSELPHSSPDAVVLLECDRLERSGFECSDFQAMNAAMTINIDHHLSGRAFADFNWIDPRACAVGLMIYNVAIAAAITISPQMAGCLYAAVLTDTGSFAFSTTTAETFGCAEHLLECGADANAITQSIYFSNPPGKVRLLGIALSNMQIEGAVCWSSITLEEMQRAGATVEDCEGVVNYLIGIAGVQAAVLLRQTTALQEFRLSLRSKGKIDVAAVANHFGGGGHRNASGCTLGGSQAEVTARVLALLQSACREQTVGGPVLPPTLLA